MTGRLDGTVALVTGASSGIGAATARVLAGHGAAVALAAPAQGPPRRSGCGGHRPGRALAIETDVTDRPQAIAAVEQAVAAFGQLDIVINNAGVMLLGPAVEAPIEEWDRMVALNVLGALYVAHAAMPHLLAAAESSARRVADLVNISSVAGRTTRVGSAVYNLTKHGLGAFSESLRQEVTRRHVRVSLVEPGAVITELPDHVRPEVAETVRARLESMERLEADDIADAVEYIVSRPRRVAINEMLIRPTEQEL